MEYVYLSAIIGLCFFNFFAYRRGLKDGLALNKGQPIAPIQTPVEVVQKHMDNRTQAKQSKDQEDALAQGLANLFAYDGTPQPQPKEGDK